MPPEYANVTKYEVYLAVDEDGAGETIYIGNTTADVNSFIVPQDTHLGNSTLNFTYLLVFTHTAEGDTVIFPEVIMDLYFRVHDVVFVDQDLDASEIGGVITWSNDPTSLSLTAYRVYLAADEFGGNRLQLLPDVPFGDNNLTIPAETSTAGFTHVLVYVVSVATGLTGDVAVEMEQSLPRASSLSEALGVGLDTLDRHSPVAFVAFTDFDLDAGQLGGTVSWGSPLDTVSVTEYNVYLAEGASGAGRLHLATLPALGARSFLVPADTALASFTHVLVYPASAIAEKSTTESLLIDDTSASVSALAFEDLDLDGEELGGTLTWALPANFQHARRIQAFNVYLAMGPSGEQRAQVGQQVGAWLSQAGTSGTTQFDVPSDTSVYSSDPVKTITCDFTLADAVTSVYYNGQDVTASVSGVLGEWSSTKRLSFVEVPSAYLVISGRGDRAGSSLDFCRLAGFQLSCSDGLTSGDGSWEALGSAAALGSDHRQGGGSGWASPCAASGPATLASDPAAAWIWAAGGERHVAFRWASPSSVSDPTSYLPWTHILVYPQSWLQEISVPAALAVPSDTVASAAAPSFVDEDTRDGLVGGRLSWRAEGDLSAVAGYSVYLAGDENGTDRALLASVAGASTTALAVPAGTELGNATHFLVCPFSSFAERSTPAAAIAYDDFHEECDALDAVRCGPAAWPGNCGLGALHATAVEAAVGAARLAGQGLILTSAVDVGGFAAGGRLAECGIGGNYRWIYYKARNTTAGELQTGFTCRYSCSAGNRSACRWCRPPATSAGAPDADGLSVWQYLACRYRGWSSSYGDGLAYSYVFADGRFAGTGDEVSALSCDQLSVRAAVGGSAGLLVDTTGLQCTGGNECSVSVLRL